MFRKTGLALAAVATLAAAAAIPTTASANHWNGGWHRPYYSPVARYHAPYYAYHRSYCYTKKRWVHTRWGWRVHRIRVCR